MNKAVSNFYSAAKLPLCEAVKLASLSPARSIGEDKLRGSLSEGKFSDIIISDENFNIERTIVCGKDVYKKPQEF